MPTRSHILWGDLLRAWVADGAAGYCFRLHSCFRGLHRGVRGCRERRQASKVRGINVCLCGSVNLVQRRSRARRLLDQARVSSLPWRGVVRVLPPALCWRGCCEKQSLGWTPNGSDAAAWRPDGGPLCPGGAYSRPPAARWTGWSATSQSLSNRRQDGTLKRSLGQVCRMAGVCWACSVRQAGGAQRQAGVRWRQGRDW